jgi:hypothetical protein
VRKLRLPSGKQIEVVVFGSTLRRSADDPVRWEAAEAPTATCIAEPERRASRGRERLADPA